MEIPRSTPGPTIPTIRFAEVARRLGAAAHAHGLAVPAFRCPPRTAGVARTIRRYPGGTVVSVRLRDREFAAVVDDMVEGVLVANQVAAPDAERLRPALLAAADGSAPAGEPDAPQRVVAEPEARAA
ncbi:MAG TPA: hypothetical protein VFZ17_07775 [Acidimicrobiia bacterium]|nr:hypothetical protein [Acidimicrobiia bacterium]